MAETCMSVSLEEQAEIASLKETLCKQQMILHKLYNELEMEREASATAATEALSMIVRLQCEKAVAKMEAEQYKRLVEEKLHHAEESLSLFEDVIYQKEMESASLDYQIQAYRCKLLSIGCVDPGIGEIQFPGNFQNFKGGNSAPLFRVNSAYERRGIGIEREDLASPERDLISKKMELINQNLSDFERKSDDCSCSIGINSSYWEQISNLDERVKEIAGENFANSRREMSSLSPVSQFSSNGNSPEGTRKFTMDVNELEQAKHPGAFQENEINNYDQTCCRRILDVYEVPHVNQHHQTKCVLQPKDEGKMVTIPREDGSKSHDFVPLKVLESQLKTANKWLKKLEGRSGVKDLHRPSENVGIGCSLAIEAQSVGEESSGRGEELRLLNEIKLKLNEIQSEVIILKTMRHTKTYKQDLLGRVLQYLVGV